MITFNDVAEFLKSDILECDPKDGYCGKCDKVRAIIKVLQAEPNTKEILREVYDLTEGPFDDPVISRELYEKMEKIFKI